MPKKYPVEISEDAEWDVAQFHARIAWDKPGAADRWAEAVRDQMLSLNQLPERYEVIPEADQFSAEYRHIIFGNYRIIYRVEHDRVVIVRVIHTSFTLTRRMLPEP